MEAFSAGRNHPGPKIPRMTFNSVSFLVFFPLVTALFFLLPHRWRWFMLLVASCYFYMAFIPSYILLLLFTITVDYFAGMAIEDSRGGRRRLLLLASMAANLGVLSLFKYFNFINHNVALVARWLNCPYTVPASTLILPIGLSFYAFQSLSYTIEVYRGQQKAERRFGRLALYVMFYPQLVAGPIERPQNLLHQLEEYHAFDALRAVEGLRLMLWGFFKKVVVADRLSLYANEVFNHPEAYHGLAVLLGIYAFAVQIYCDFSGYSDIAIGVARVMGVDLMTNFRQPYFSESIGEFWKRWHISLSTWFRDYLYIPLGGNRVTRTRGHVNLLVVFLVSGLWHGANWTFVIWGGLHGLYLVFSRLTEPVRARWTSALGLARFPAALSLFRKLFVFHLVCFGWIFFRAGSLADAGRMILNLGVWEGFQWKLAGLSFSSLTVTLGAVVVLWVVDGLHRREPLWNWIGRGPAWLRWTAYAALALAIMNLGVAQEIPFIYFQF